uniref:Uncharacterized protein n=1 Tax=Mycena chlorophos TaxID=658473 RepID=A0ABQ0LT56_MYCCL|nr:predicted protein [Mycena chlorophos]
MYRMSTRARARGRFALAGCSSAVAVHSSRKRNLFMLLPSSMLWPSALLPLLLRHRWHTQVTLMEGGTGWTRTGSGSVAHDASAHMCATHTTHHTSGTAPRDTPHLPCTARRREGQLDEDLGSFCAWEPCAVAVQPSGKRILFVARAPRGVCRRHRRLGLGGSPSPLGVCDSTIALQDASRGKEARPIFGDAAWSVPNGGGAGDEDP